jgi:hypothetical protein
VAALTIDYSAYVHIFELLLILLVHTLEICTSRLLSTILSVRLKMFIWIGIDSPPLC